MISMLLQFKNIIILNTVVIQYLMQLTDISVSRTMKYIVRID